MKDEKQQRIEEESKIGEKITANSTSLTTALPNSVRIKKDLYLL